MLSPPCILANVSVSSSNSGTVAPHGIQPNSHPAATAVQTQVPQLPFTKESGKEEERESSSAGSPRHAWAGEAAEPWFPFPRANFPLSSLPWHPPRDGSQFCVTPSGSRDDSISVPAELHLLPSFPHIILPHECYEMPQSTSGMSLTAPTSRQRWQLLTGLLSIVSESLWDESDC